MYTVHIRKFIVALIILSIISTSIGIKYIYNVKKNVQADTRMYLSEAAEQGAKLAKVQVEKNLDLVWQIANEFENDTDDYEKNIFMLHNHESKVNFKYIGFANEDGKAFTCDGLVADVSDREYFYESIKGNQYISDPLKSKVNNDSVVIYSVPMKKNNKIVGVLFAAHYIENLSQTTEQTYFDGKGISYIVDKSGAVLLRSDKSPAITNIYSELSSNSENKINEFNLTLKENKKSINIMKMGKNMVYIATAPIEGLRDWVYVAAVDTKIIDSKSSNIILRAFFYLICVSFIFIWLILYILKTKKQSEEALYKLAYIDNLADINNQDGFIKQGSKFLENNLICAVLCFDINNLKLINDTYGYETGNYLLKQIATELECNFKNGEVYARINNDIFAVLMKYESDNELKNLINSFIMRLENNLSDSSKGINVKITMGAYVIKESCEDLRKALNNANTARSDAKYEEYVQYKFFNKQIQKKYTYEENLISELKAAVNKNALQVYYQPKFSLSTGKIVGVEALVRWNHPEKGTISPAVFIPLAERSGLIMNISRYVFDKVCSDISNLKAQNLLIPVSVNLSRIDLHRIDLISFSQDTLRKYSLSPKYIEIELTETISSSDIQHTKMVLEKLKDVGFTVAIDDFGTGYSSLAYLKTIPFNVLKLDKSFISDLDLDDRSKSIAESLIALAKSLGMTVVCEGVETKEQAEFLRGAGCEIVQGFYFAKPMPITELGSLLKEQRRTEFNLPFLN